MTLGELIAALEAADPNKLLPYGFDHPHSYRGYYDHLAFEPARNVTVGAMLADARTALGTTYEGWKGGDYQMDEDTDCWLSNRGSVSDESIGPTLLRLMLAATPPESTPADELHTAATKVREHAEIFGGAATEIADLLDRVAETVERDGGAIRTSTDDAALDAARAINGGAL